MHSIRPFTPGWRPRLRKIWAIVLAVAAAISFLALREPIAAGQERSEEVAATLATGRVIFCVTKDAIVVAGIEGTGEPGSSPPAIVPLNQGRIGVVLGANEWSNPSSGANALRLDAELPHAASLALTRPRDTGQPPAPGAAIDLNQPTAIEAIGVEVLETLRPQVARIHRKLDLKPDEPLVELLLADYVVNYGPEVWSLQYRVRQQDLGNNYWETRPLRPAYNQLYPPEKGQPRTLMEALYPTNTPEPALLALLQGHDQRIEAMTNSSADMTRTIAAILEGDSRKAAAVPLTDFLRAALPAVAGASAKMSIAKLDPDHGFQWVVAPPNPPKGAPAQAKPSEPLEPDAPSLRGHQQRN